MKNILITGGAGFIGSEIVEQLYQCGNYNVTVLDSLSPQIHGDNWETSYTYRKIKGKCNFIKGDICRVEDIARCIADCEYIIHLAAETGTGQSMYQINKYNEVNIMGLSNIFQAIMDNKEHSKVRKIILSSSRSVYGEGKYLCPKCGIVYPKSRKKDQLDNADFSMYCDICGTRCSQMATSEDSDLNPASLYAYTKLSQEKMIEVLCAAMDINYTIFRFQNVYGAGQSLKNPYTGILSIFTTLMKNNEDINVFEDGNESRDFINVKDIARGVILSIENTATNNTIFNLGSGEETTVKEITGILKNAYQSKSRIIISGDYRIGDIAHNYADMSKANKIMGFRPSISLDEGLKEFCKWADGEACEKVGYLDSLEEMERKGLFVKR